MQARELHAMTHRKDLCEFFTQVFYLLNPERARQQQQKRKKSRRSVTTVQAAQQQALAP